MTKREFYKAIIDSTETFPLEIREYAQNLLNGMEGELAKRSSKQKQKKAEENAPLREAILNLLRNEGPMVTSAIAEKLEILSQKASPLCRNMVEEGLLTVENVKIPKKGAAKQYAIASQLVEIGE